MPYILLVLVVVAIVVICVRLWTKNGQLEHELGTITQKLRDAKSQGGPSADKQPTSPLPDPGVVNQVEVGIAVVNDQGVVTFTNAYFSKLTGIVESELINKSWNTLLSFKNAKDDIVSSPLDTTLKGTVYEIHDLFLHTHKGNLPVIGRVTPLKKDMHIQGALIALFDATNMTKREEESRAFYSTAAHELRTPLTVVRSSLDLVIQKFSELPSEKVQEFLRDAYTATEQLNNLLNDFLSVTRLDLGRTALNLESFDLAILTKEVIEIFKPQAGAKKLYLNLDLKDSPTQIQADKTKVREILTNLLSNALKYTLQGGITVSISREGNILTLRVTDSGIGISKDNQPLLFKKFQQVGGSRELATGKSTGLGLYIAKQYALLMKGDLVLESSEPTKGSTFKLTLPVPA